MMRLLLAIAIFVPFQIFSSKDPQVEHIKVIREIKERQQEKKKKDQEKKHELPSKFTQMEAFFYVEAGKNQNEWIKSYSKDHDAWLKKYKKPKYFKFIKGMLEKEKEMSGYIAFYHGYSPFVDLLFDLITELRNWLEPRIGVEKMHLRLGETKQKTLTNFIKHWDSVFYEECKEMRKYLKSYKCVWNDQKDPLKSQLLSVTFSPFSGIRANDTTFSFFKTARSLTSGKKLFSSFFQKFDFDKKFKEEIEILHRKYTFSKDQLKKITLEEEYDDDDEMERGARDTGSILQIFIPKEKVDKFAYLSLTKGTPYREEIDGKIYDRNVAEFVEKYKNDPNSIGKVICEIQARIVFLPGLFSRDSGIKIIKHNLIPEKRKQEYKKKLRAVMDEMISEWIANEGYEKLAKEGRNLPFVKLLRMINKGQKEREKYAQELMKKK